jgi:RNA polymerase sigma factor (sigma-70 family)
VVLVGGGNLLALPTLLTDVDTTGAEPRDDLAVAGGFEWFYGARWARTVGLAALLLGDRSIAEDLAHDAFVEMQQRWASVRQPDVYLATIVRRRCARARLANARLTPLREDLDVDVAFDLAASTRVDLIAALRHLSADHREVIVLRFYADLTEAGIAAVLDVRIGTVKSRLHRALDALKRELTT